MAETSTKERAEKMAEQTFQRAEDTLGSMMDNNRQTWLSVMEYNRHSIRTSYEFARNVQEEGMRLTDTWLDTMSKFQKTYMKSFQEYNNRVQDMAERTVRENNERFEEAIDQGIEMVSPGTSRHSNASKRR
jgi:hypothetical protein